MSTNTSILRIVVGAIIAFFLQVMVAPYIAIGAAVPNFILAYVLVACLLTRNEQTVLAFVMGMLFNLVGGGPVGALACLLIIAGWAVSHVFAVMDNDTLFMPMIILVIAIFAIEICYGALLLGVGINANPIEALVFRSLPCAFYDSIIALVIYVIGARFLVVNDMQRTFTQL